MRKHLIFSAIAAGVAVIATGIWQHQQAQAAKWAAFEKFPYLDVRDDWCTARRVHPRHCLTPGNLAKMTLQGR
jgi:hypothetical protein